MRRHPQVHFRLSLEQVHDPERRGGGVGLAGYRAERREIAVDEAGSNLPCRNSLARQSGEEAGIAARPDDDGAIERRRQPVERLVARRRVRDQLGDHRIVERRDLGACLDAGIDADVGRQFQRHDPAGRGQKAALGILGIKPRLDGVAVDADLRLLERQFFAGGDAELPFDQIEAGDRFGHRMLDLQARVHLHEPEAVRRAARRCRRR